MLLLLLLLLLLLACSSGLGGTPRGLTQSVVCGVAHSEATTTNGRLLAATPGHDGGGTHGAGGGRVPTQLLWSAITEEGDLLNSTATQQKHSRERGKTQRWRGQGELPRHDQDTHLLGNWLCECQQVLDTPAIFKLLDLQLVVLGLQFKDLISIDDAERHHNTETKLSVSYSRCSISLHTIQVRYLLSLVIEIHIGIAQRFLQLVDLNTGGASQPDTTTRHGQLACAPPPL